MMIDLTNISVFIEKIIKKMRKLKFLLKKYLIHFDFEIIHQGIQFNGLFGFLHVFIPLDFIIRIFDDLIKLQNKFYHSTELELYPHFS